MLRLVTAVCLCALTVSLGACSSTSSKIVGKWQAIAANDRSAYEFFKDGTVLYYIGGEPQKGTWKFLDDGRLVVDIPVMGGEVTIYNVTFEGDTAVFKSSDGRAQVFKKVNEFVSLGPTRATQDKLSRSKSNLNQIAKCCALYLNEYGDNRWYPKSLAGLLDKVMPNKDVLVSPLDDDPPKLVNGLPCSYVSCFDKYPNLHFRDDFPPDVIMAWDRKPFVEGNRCVLFMNSQTECVDEARFQKELQKLDREVQRAMGAQPPK